MAVLWSIYLYTDQDGCRDLIRPLHHTISMLSKLVCLGGALIQKSEGHAKANLLELL